MLEEKGTSHAEEAAIHMASSAPSSSKQPSIRPVPRRRNAADSLGGLWAIGLTAAIVAALYFGREVLIPLSLALLITFLLAPLVEKMERLIKRVPAVLIALSLILAAALSSGWVITRQAVDLAEQFPSYKENIRAKLRSIKVPEDGVFTKLSEALNDLKKDVPDVLKSEKADTPGTDGQPAPQLVKVMESSSPNPFEVARTWFAPVLGPIGTSALVFLLVAFMLLKWDDLRGRIVRLVGQGRISMTTRAMDDAGSRIRRYLLMQLVVNVTYGIPLAIGLYFIGVPNAILWGALATVLRFIPYIGPWIAATFPMLISLAVSPSWLPPLLTLSLFIAIELISNNVLEPWLYGSSTGVSSIALIVAAVFWTWMWGPVGLVLATPITVCLVVMGQHIPQLSFLNVVMGEDEALTPAEDCYHRLLRVGHHDEVEFADAYLKANSLTDFYDQVLVPVVIAAETDYRQGLLESEEHTRLTASIHDLLEDISEKVRPDPTAISPERITCRIECLAARAQRDDTAGMMLAHALQQKGIDAHVTHGKRSAAQLATSFEENLPDLVIITAVAPTKAIHARNLVEKIRSVVPEQKIAVVIFGNDEGNQGEIKALKSGGIEIVFHRIADAVGYCEKTASEMAVHLPTASLPANEEERLLAIERLGVLNAVPTQQLNRMAQKFSRIFEVPVVSITIVDRERQVFKAQHGMPPALAEAGESPRCDSVCTYVVSSEATIVIEDMKRDRRFADNSLIQTNGIRFYAGAPLRTEDGFVIGSLCLMDVKPRRFSRSEQRLLEENAVDVMETIQRLSKEKSISVQDINMLAKAGMAEET